jgi:hypothetical protein
MVLCHSIRETATCPRARFSCCSRCKSRLWKHLSRVLCQDERRQFTSQGYDVRDSNVPRYPATSPTRPTGSSNAPYVAQASGIPGMFGYDVPQTPSVVETDLPLAFRGMVVEDNHQASRCPIPSMPSHGLTPHHRAHTLHPPRTPFNIYPPTEYAQFYNNPGRESCIDHPYIYDVYRAGPDPSLYVAPRGVSAQARRLFIPVSLPYMFTGNSLFSSTMDEVAGRPPHNFTILLTNR